MNRLFIRLLGRLIDFELHIFVENFIIIFCSGQLVRAFWSGYLFTFITSFYYYSYDLLGWDISADSELRTFRSTITSTLPTVRDQAATCPDCLSLKQQPYLVEGARTPLRCQPQLTNIDPVRETKRGDLSVSAVRIWVGRWSTSWSFR